MFICVKHRCDTFRPRHTYIHTDLLTYLAQWGGTPNILYVIELIKLWCGGRQAARIVCVICVMHAKLITSGNLVIRIVIERAAQCRWHPFCQGACTHTPTALLAWINTINCVVLDKPSPIHPSIYQLYLTVCPARLFLSHFEYTFWWKVVAIERVHRRFSISPARKFALHLTSCYGYQIGDFIISKEFAGDFRHNKHNQ